MEDTAYLAAPTPSILIRNGENSIASLCAREILSQPRKDVKKNRNENSLVIPRKSRHKRHTVTLYYSFLLEKRWDQKITHLEIPYKG